MEKHLIIGRPGCGKTKTFLPKVLSQINKNNYLISSEQDSRIDFFKSNENWSSVSYKIYNNEELTKDDLLFIDEPSFVNFTPNLIDKINNHENVIICFPFELNSFSKHEFSFLYPFLNIQDFKIIDVEN